MKRQKLQKPKRRQHAFVFLKDWRFQVGAAVVLAALVFLLPQLITYVHERSQAKTIVLTVNGAPMQAVTFNYYFRDCYDDFTTAYSEAVGSPPPIQNDLDQQQYEGNTTYADCFYDMALENAQRTLLIAAAVQDSSTQWENEAAQAVSATVDTMSQRAEEQGYSDLDAFLQSFYGPLASETTYREYLSQRKLAEAYSQYIYDSAPVTASGEEAQAQRQAAWDQWFAGVTDPCKTVCDSSIQSFLFMEP